MEPKDESRGTGGLPAIDANGMPTPAEAHRRDCGRDPVGEGLAPILDFRAAPLRSR